MRGEEEDSQDGVGTCAGWLLVGVPLALVMWAVVVGFGLGVMGVWSVGAVLLGQGY